PTRPPAGTQSRACAPPVRSATPRSASAARPRSSARWCPRGFLTAFAVPGAPGVNPRQSGRLELAGWLASPKNPLTPRVIVNRVWGRLFGQGIVTTADNFGVTGDRPSHPELPHHLASRRPQ